MKSAIDIETNEEIYIDNVDLISRTKKYICSLCGDKCLLAMRKNKPSYFRHSNSLYLMCPNHIYYNNLENVLIIC